MWPCCSRYFNPIVGCADIEFCVNGVANYDTNTVAKNDMDYSEAKIVAKRLFSWGLIFGLLLAILQIGSLSAISMLPEEVQKAAEVHHDCSLYSNHQWHYLHWRRHSTRQPEYLILAKTTFLATISMLSLRTIGSKV